MNLRTPPNAHRACRAFTLVELLVSMAVLISLSYLLLRTTIASQDAVTREIQNMDAIKSARVALDTLTGDIATLVTRGGTTVLFRPGDARTNDTLRFITSCRNSSDSERARMTLTAYCVQSRFNPVLDCEMPMLVRESAPLLWPVDQDPRAEDYVLKDVLQNRVPVESDVVAEHVFRFEIVWLHKDGTISRDPRLSSDPEDGKDSNGFIWVDLTQVRGFVVSVAALDGPGQRHVANDTGFARVQTALTSLTSAKPDHGRIPSSQWQEDIADIASSVPRQRIRVLQRTYFLPQ